MRFLRDRRTNPHDGQAETPRRPPHTRRRRSGFEILEDRSLLSTLDVISGFFSYSESYSGTTNQLSIVSTGTGPGGTYTVHSAVQTITLSSNAQIAGWSNIDANTATGPTGSVSSMTITAVNQDSNIAIGSIDAPATVTGFQAVVLGSVPGGQPGTLQGIRQPISIVNAQGQTALTFDDSGDATAQNWAVSTGSVDSPSPAQITYTPAQISQVTLNGGSGGNTFSVSDTTQPTRINAGTGVDSITVTGTTAALTIDGQGVGGAAATDSVTLFPGLGIAGVVNVVGTTGTTALVINDSDSGIGRSPAIAFGSISGYTTQPIQYNVAALNSITVLAGAGADALSVNFGAGNPIPAAGGLIFDGGPGNNSIALSGGAFTNELIQSSGPNSGTITLDTSVITFRNLAPIFDISPAVNFQFDAPDGNNLINVINGPNVQGVVTTEIQSGDVPTHFELVDFANKTNVLINAVGSLAPGNQTILLNNTVPAPGLSRLEIQTGDGTDTVDVQASPPNVAIVISTGNNDDVVSFLAAGLGAGGSNTVNGGAGVNTMNVNAGGGLVTFTATSVNVSGRPAIGLTSFTTVNVTNAGDPPLTPVPVQIGGTVSVPLVNVNAGSFDDTDPRGQVSNFTATIDWGDGSPATPGTVTQPGGPGTRFNVLGTHTYTTTGTFNVVVNVTSTGNTSSTVLGGTRFNVQDVGGSTTRINSTATVAAASIDYIPIFITVTEDVAFTTPVVTFSTRFFTAAGFTATIDWGDGTAPSAGSVVEQTPGTFVVNGTHTYLRESAPGQPYAVTVRITDPRGQQATVNTTATVLSNDIVTNVNDSGPGSLRAAILDVNADQIPTTIRFNIPGAGPHRISPITGLPVVNVPVNIDGRTQPGFQGTPLVELNGGRAGANADGLTINGGASTIQALVINGFGGSGVILEGPGRNRIIGNRIGTDVSGTRGVANGNGIDIFDSGNNVVGGTTAAERNIISGNRIVGIQVSCLGASSNRIQGNFIGTDVSGNSAVPNFQGIFLLGAPRNLIGGTAPGAGNLISGNLSAGVQIYNDATVFNVRPLCNPPGVATGNVLQGNRIGTNAAGTARLGNTQGIFINDASANLVGGTTPAAANIIAGNRSIGVQILGDNATRNAILGNFVGTNRAQAPGLGNSVGVYVYSRTGNVVGLGSAPGANTIAFNRQAGVRVRPLSQGPSVERVDLLPVAGGPITTVVVTFTTYMSRARVANRSNYVITPLGTNSQPGPRVQVANVVYNEVYRTAILTLASPLARNSTFRFRVVGTSPNGLTDRAGNFLNGTPSLPRVTTGSDFQETFSRGRIV